MQSEEANAIGNIKSCKAGRCRGKGLVSSSSSGQKSEKPERSRREKRDAVLSSLVNAARTHLNDKMVV